MYKNTLPLELLTVDEPVYSFKEAIKRRSDAWIQDAIIFSCIKTEIMKGNHWNQGSLFTKLIEDSRFGYLMYQQLDVLDPKCDLLNEEEFFSPFYLFE